MKAPEFAAWLEGYLDGKDTLNKTQAERILYKAKRVIFEYIPKEPIREINIRNEYPPYFNLPGTTAGNASCIKQRSTSARNQITLEAYND